MPCSHCRLPVFGHYPQCKEPGGGGGGVYSLIWLILTYLLSTSKITSFIRKNLLWNPTYKLKSYGGHSFAVAAASLWNALPQSVEDSASVDIFKCRLNKHLFSNAYQGSSFFLIRIVCRQF